MRQKNLFFDDRWIGGHGIGRYAHEISFRSKFPFLKVSDFLKSKPSSPIDPLLQFVKLPFNGNSIFFSPGYNPGPFFSSYVQSIFTIHDLIHIDFDKNSIKKTYYDQIIKRAISKAPFIFTVSNFSRQRIIEYFKLDISKVIVTGNGISSCFFDVIEKYPHRRPYIFSPTNRRVNKNEPRLLEAYSNLGLSKDFDLLFLGAPDAEILNVLSDLKLESVHFLGNVSDNELVKIYRGATLISFVSLYEGFGVPIIEGMASDVPVVTSRVTSMPEIAGDGATLVDPYSVESIMEGFQKAIFDNTYRASQVIKGRERCALYSWDKVVRTVSENLGHL